MCTLTWDKENDASQSTSLVHLTEDICPSFPNKRHILQLECRHTSIKLFSIYLYTFQITGYVISMDPRNVTNGDVGAFFHQLIFRENKQWIMSKWILCCKIKEDSSVRLGLKSQTSPLLPHSQQITLAFSASWRKQEPKISTANL